MNQVISETPRIEISMCKVVMVCQNHYKALSIAWVVYRVDLLAWGMPLENVDSFLVLLDTVKIFKL